MLTVRSIINIASQTVPPIIPVVQGDTGRAILFTLADFTIPAGATATYYVQKPSGEAVYNNATIDGNNVLVNLTAQSIIEKGDNYGQVRIAVGEDVVTSFDFILLVKEFRGIDAVQSLTEMNIFDKAVEQAADAIDEVKTDALEAIDDAKDEAIEEVTSNFDLKLDASSTKGVQNQVITQAINTVNNAIGDLSGETITPTATNNYGIGGSVGQVIETWATTDYWHGIYAVTAGNRYAIQTVSDYPQQIVVWFTNASNTILEIHKAFATDPVEMVCTAPTGATKLFVMSYGYDAYHGTVQKVEPLSETVSNLKEDFDDTFTLAYGVNRNPNNDTVGYLKDDGTIASYGDWKTTDYCYVADLDSIIMSSSRVGESADVRYARGMHFLCAYGADKSFIRQVYTTGLNDWEVESGVAYVRFCYHSNEDENIMLAGGTYIAPFVLYKVTKVLKPQYLSSLNPVIENQESVISSDNEYDSTMMIYGYWIGGDGVIHQLSDNYGYAKIPVKAGATYVLSYHNINPSYYPGASGGYLVYDENNNLVENIESDTLSDASADAGYSSRYITIPDGGAYLLITLAFGATWNNVDSFTLYKVNLVGGVLTGLYGATVDAYTLKWKNKKWVALGDSLTEVNTRATLHYHDYINEATGINVVNMGASGTGYKRTEDESKAFYQRILNVPTDADVVTIFGSGNDLNYSAMGFNSFAEALGAVTDSTTDTICGCINKTIDNLYSVLPTVPLALVTPCPWQSYNPANVGNNMDLYAQAIVEICKRHGIPCLDLYHCSGLRPWDATFRQLCYSNDDGGGTHPDNNGHKILAPHFASLLETLIL